MPGTTYDPQQSLKVDIVAHSPHTFAYKLWVAEQGATAWTEIDSGDDASPQFVSSKHYPVGTHVAYTLLIGGNPTTDWRIQVTLSQGSATLACSPPADSGTTNDDGVARVDKPVRLA